MCIRDRNKQYALEAVNALRQKPELATDIMSLWKRVIRGGEKTHNSQMDVVIALWEKGWIVQET
ncbi:MAG: hypothetical protein N3G78_13390, partial [Desulfobacterota bacterium]|nr:hypothetical protein [Thermodesulfobacteriota bacterium]